MFNRGIRTVLVEPQPLFRDALERTFDQDEQIEVVGAFQDDVPALTVISRLDPAVVVAGAGAEDGEAAAIVGRLAAAAHGIRTLLLAARTDAGPAVAALRAGARGYLSKQRTGDEIRAAVLAVARGQTVLCPQIQAEIARAMRSGEPDAYDLTERERAVIALCAEGLSREQIGRRLHISAATVKAHLAQVYAKLGVSGQTAAVAVAIRGGVV